MLCKTGLHAWGLFGLTGLLSKYSITSSEAEERARTSGPKGSRHSSRPRHSCDNNDVKAPNLAHNGPQHNTKKPDMLCAACRPEAGLPTLSLPTLWY
jgi:hypothetical protein